MKTYIVGYKAKPDLDSPHFGEIACAFITCWILCETSEEAKNRALKVGDQLGWIFQNWEACHVTTRNEWLNDADALNRFDRAQREGIGTFIQMNTEDPTSNN